jgi:hypothetical protein
MPWRKLHFSFAILLPCVHTNTKNRRRGRDSQDSFHNNNTNALPNIAQQQPKTPKYGIQNTEYGYYAREMQTRNPEKKACCTIYKKRDERTLLGSFTESTKYRTTTAHNTYLHFLSIKTRTMQWEYYLYGAYKALSSFSISSAVLVWVWQVWLPSHTYV